MGILPNGLFVLYILGVSIFIAVERCSVLAVLSLPLPSGPRRRPPTQSSLPPPLLGFPPPPLPVLPLPLPSSFPPPIPALPLFPSFPLPPTRPSSASLGPAALAFDALPLARPPICPTTLSAAKDLPLGTEAQIVGVCDRFVGLRLGSGTSIGQEAAGKLERRSSR